MGYATYSDFGLVGSLSGFTSDRFLVLSHPSASNSLVITEFGESGYNSTITNFLTSDGRTVQGTTRVQGGGYFPKQQWEIQECIVNDLQLKMFDALLALQTSTGVAMSLQDSFSKYQYIPGTTELPVWVSGSPTTNVLGFSEGYTVWNAFVDVDSGYKTFIGSERYLLQFTANCL